MHKSGCASCELHEARDRDLRHQNSTATVIELHKAGLIPDDQLRKLDAPPKLNDAPPKLNDAPPKLVVPSTTRDILAPELVLVQVQFQTWQVLGRSFSLAPRSASSALSLQGGHSSIVMIFE